MGQGEDVTYKRSMKVFSVK